MPVEIIGTLRLTIKTRFKNIILFILLAASLVAGCYYAYTRDLSNGCNKIYAAPADAEGQVALAEIVEQRFIPGHDYDGVSLLIDHNRSANAGTVTVTIYRVADDSCVLTRTIPVVMTARGRYTYFASMETIAAEAGEEFYLVASYNGPTGLVIARTGDMSGIATTACTVGGNESVETLLLGIVTDYQNDPVNTRLLMAAFVLLTVAAGMLILGRNSIKHNTGRGKATFLAAYYGVITGFLLIALSMSATRSYTWVQLGDTAQTIYDSDDGGHQTGEKWLLRDDGSLDAYITLPVDDICGISIPVDIPSYLYTSEYITVQVVEPATDRILQTSRYAMADLDSNEIYLSLDDRYNAGTRIVLHIATSGMSYAQSPGFYVAYAGDSGNIVYYGGVQQDNQQLMATLYQTGVTHSYTRSLMFYAVAILIGIILAWLLYRENISIIDVMKDQCADGMDRSSSAAPIEVSLSDSTNRRNSHKRTIVGLLFTVIFGIVVIDYAYAEGIAPTSGNIYPELVSYSADGEYDWTVIPTDDERVQAFTATGNSLSGIGLMIAADDKGESINATTDCVIRVQIEDVDGNILDNVQYAVAELEQVGALIGEDYTYNLPSGFYYIPMNEDLDVDEGTELIFRIAVIQNGSDSVWIAENPYDQANLLLAYSRYTDLGTTYWLVMIIMLLSVCALFLSSRNQSVDLRSAFIALGIITGLMLSIVIPPFCIPDEMTHIKQIYYISNQLAGIYDGVGPLKLNVRTEDLVALHNSTTTITVERYHDVLSGLFGCSAYDGARSVLSYADVIPNASFWTYLPSVVGFLLFRLLGFNCITAIMGARWCNLAVGIILIQYGIRKCPFGKYSLMIIMLFPQLLELIASCNYDAMIIAFAFLYIGNAMNLVCNKRCSSVDWLITLIAALLLCVNKHGVYLPLLGILIIPLLDYFTLLEKRKQLILVAMAFGVVVITYVYFSSSVSVYSTADSVSLGGIIHNPLYFIHLLEHTLVTKGDMLFSMMIANGLGAVEVNIPRNIVDIICILLIISLRADRDYDDQLPRWSAIYLFALQIIGVLLVCLAFTLTMTVPTATTIGGMQGRYFLPYLVLFCIAATILLPRGRDISRGGLLYGMSIIHMTTIGLVFVDVFGT